MQLPKKVTGKWLRRRLRACEQVDEFETLYPDGIVPTPAKILSAVTAMMKILYMDDSYVLRNIDDYVLELAAWFAWRTLNKKQKKELVKELWTRPHTFEEALESMSTDLRELWSNPDDGGYGLMEACQSLDISALKMLKKWEKVRK